MPKETSDQITRLLSSPTSGRIAGKAILYQQLAWGGGEEKKLVAFDFFWELHRRIGEGADRKQTRMRC